MSIFSSIVRLPSRDISDNRREVRQVDEKELNARLALTPGNRTSPEGVNLMGPALAGGAIAGIGAATIAYMKSPNAGLKVAKRVASFLNIDATKAARSNSGKLFNEQLVGTAQDLVYLAHRVKNVAPELMPKVLNEIQTKSTQRLGKNDGVQASIGDLLKSLRQTDKDLSNVLEASLNTIADVTSPQGISLETIKKEFKLGKNILNEKGKVADYRGLTPGGAFEKVLDWSHDNLKAPFLDFAPTDLLLGNAWSHTRKVSGVKATDVVRGEAIGSDGVVAGGKIFTKSGEVIEGDFGLYRQSSSLAESINIVKGQDEYKNLSTLIEDGDFDFVSKKFMGFLEDSKWASADKGIVEELTGRVNKIQSDYGQDNITLGQMKFKINEVAEDIGKVSPQFENFFLSPKYSGNKSVPGEIGDWVKRIHSGVPTLRKDSEGAPIRDLVTDPLSLIEKGKLTFKGDVRGYNYLDDAGEVIGQGARGPKKAGGFEDSVPGVHRPQDTVTTFEGFKNQPVVAREFAFAEKGEAAKSFAHYMFNRPAKILEALTGFGIKPNKSVVATALMGTAGIYGALETVRQGLSYANFIGQGIPSKAIAGTAGAAQVGVQAGFTGTGISTASEQLEAILPGAVNSFASQLGRVVAAPFLGAKLGEKFLPSEIDMNKFMFWKKSGDDLAEASAHGLVKGKAAGAILAAGLAVASVWLDPAKGVQQQYAEAVGDERVAVRNARWWVAGRQPYGGDYIKYFDQSWVQKLWNHDAAMKTTYGSEANAWSESWFPTPSNLFGALPLLDPYATERRNFAERPYPETGGVGENIPVVGPAFAATIGQVLKPSVSFTIPQDEGYGKYGEGGISEGARLGYDTGGQGLDPRSGGSASAITNRTVNQLQDFFGVYGFTQKLVTQNLLGTATGVDGATHEYERSSQMTSQGAALEGLNLGGFMGTTEYFRRIYNTRPNSNNYYNPLPNNSPGWLPGSGSIFAGDRDTSMDFHTGDPYSKLELGEVRLPGPGFEATSGYHGGDAPDVVDVWSILADVAPGSEARAYYETQVTSMAQSGQLDQSGQDIYNRTMSEAQARRAGKYQFKDYANETVTEPGPMAQLTKDYLGHANVNIEQAEINPVLRPVREAWDAVTHTRVPGLAWAQGKFMHNRTPLEEYVATQVHGTEFADWGSPLQGFIKPGLQEMRGAVQGSGYIPHDVQKRWETEEYYDKLKYLKSRRLEDRATGLGQQDLARQYQRQQQQTVVGMDYSSGGVNSNIFKALSPSYRNFVPAFAKASPEEAQNIHDYLPNYQKEMWTNIWAGNNTVGGEPDLSSPRLRADQEVAEYFSQRALPDTESNVWNPDVSLDEYKVKTAEAEGLSYYQMGIPEAKARDFRALGRSNVILDTAPFLEDVEMRNKLLTELHADGNYSHDVKMSNVRQTQQINYNGQGNRSGRINEYQGRF